MVRDTGPARRRPPAGRRWGWLILALLLGVSTVWKVSGLLLAAEPEADAGPGDEARREYLQAAASDEVYWRDLLGLKVWCTQDGSRYLLGEIKTLLETGANDVMVISPCTGSVDDKEHLIPWIPGDVVIDIDLDARNVEVNWYADT